MTGLAVAAFVAGALLAAAAVELVRARPAPAGARGPRVWGADGGLIAALVRAGEEGRAPGAAERRRLLVAGGLAASMAATAFAGLTAGLAAGTAGPWLVARALRSRRLAYSRAVERGAPAIAVSLADALTGGHSLRGALTEAAASLDGPPGRELARVVAELSLGARTEDALEAMRQRVRSPAIDVLVAAALVQRRAGGDLARLLRDCARAFEDQARLEGEVRAATAQARFTGVIVAALPLGTAVLAELASPGYLRALAGSSLTVWLAGFALVMQTVAVIAIRRFGKVGA